MRLVALLVLLAGCDLIFELRDPPAPAMVDIELRRAFSDTATDETRLRIDRPVDVEPGDLLVAVVKGFSDDELELMAPPGLTVFAQMNADDCPNASWTAFFLSGRAGTETRYEFEFGAAPGDPEKRHAGMIAAYTNAGSASLITQVNPFDLVADSATTVDLDQDATETRSRMWIGAVADRPWTDLFSEGTKVAVEENLAIFDLAISDGVIPAMTYDLPEPVTLFCPGVAQVLVEP